MKLSFLIDNNDQHIPNSLMYVFLAPTTCLFKMNKEYVSEVLFYCSETEYIAPKLRSIYTFEPFEKNGSN